MGSSTSITTENSEPHGKGGAYSKGIPAATDDIDAAYSDERPSRGSLAQQDPADRGARRDGLFMFFTSRR